MKRVTLAALRGKERLAFSIVFLTVLIATLLVIHPRGASPAVITSWANQGVGVAFVAVGQTIVVLSGGIDISIGAIMALANCIASVWVNGSALHAGVGVVLVLIAGALCGLVNGIVIVYGRIQPIVATLGTGAVYSGVALLVRPEPGGEISSILSDLATGTVGRWVPASLLLLVGFVLLIWEPVRRALIGRTIYAAGSAEAAAFMSGLPLDTAKLLAYTLAGIFAALGGLFLGFQTLSGDATIGMPYTLNSVAAVVLGGTSLAGGAGSVAGSIAGAFILGTIGNLMFFAGIPPLAQPLFDGLVLLAVVTLGALGVIKTKSRIEVMQ
ncbi:ABC transporter permease [Paraburkholderia terrae]|uniref:Sugar ABC transporter permease n=1 Tax=Paraburkholderia terrae TaxID=311230 RepID=A0ABN6JXU9_9BURK|nr:ABC transporter permease [Paraburkholderia terrae]BCZ85591.1 sugar ABC transporter permease [Paraburkholderia terrae]BDC45953.1 sugar ABC transporter permease [Paraburkholderia terrae]